MKDTIKIEFSLSIITGDEKRLLEDYVDSRYFVQRKSYDEYYVKCQIDSLNVDLTDLMILAKQFRVEVLPMSVVITQK